MSKKSERNPLINLFSYSWQYAFGQRKVFVWMLILSLIGNILWVLEPIVVGRIFNSIQFSSSLVNPVSYIGWSVVLLVGIDFVAWIFHGASRVMENQNAFLIRKNYRQTMFEKVMGLPTAWHKDHHSGDTIDKINKASEKLYNFSEEFFLIVRNLVWLVSSIVVLAIFDFQLILIILLACFLVVWMIVRLDRQLIKMYKKIYKGENFITAGIYDYISNYLTIISLRLKKTVVKEMNDRSLQPFGIFMRSRKLTEFKWFLCTMIISLMTASIVFFSAYFSYQKDGVIVIGTLFILYQYLNQLGNVFYNFAWKYGEMVGQSAALNEAEIINVEYEKISQKRTVFLKKGWQSLQIRNLSFVYKNEDNLNGLSGLVKSVNLDFAPGRKIALIGVSGSGKSTTLSLLRGMHEADQVEVYCDQEEIKNGLSMVQSSSTLIPQEAEIFNNTIEYNITLGVKTKKEYLDQVIEWVNLKSLIERLAKGLETNVLEKRSFS